jgi:hypothetical protein
MTAQEIISNFGLTEDEMTERLEYLGYEVDDLDSAVYSEFRNVYWYGDLGLFLVIDDIDLDLSDEIFDQLKNLAD